MPRGRRIGIASLLLLASAAAACRQAPVGPEARNKELVGEFFAAIDGGDLDRVRELVSDDLALHVIGLSEPLGEPELMVAIETFYAAFPDNTHVIEQTIAEGDVVAVRLTQYATHRGEYEGMAATGTRVTIGAMHMARFVDGVITEWWALEDNLGLMQQLGMTLTAAGQS